MSDESDTSQPDNAGDGAQQELDDTQRDADQRIDELTEDADEMDDRLGQAEDDAGDVDVPEGDQAEPPTDVD